MDNAPIRLLIIEDNVDIATLIGDYFEPRGYTLDFAHDGVTGLHLAVTHPYDVVVLDLALPGMDGLALCDKLRRDARSSVPVLMLTARDTLEDKLSGFASGADDYLVKPFDLPELEVRIQALWRRTGGHTDTLLNVYDLSLDTGTLVIRRAGQSIPLNPVRLRILELLMSRSPEVVTRRDIERHIWGEEQEDSDTLRTHMSAIRRAVDKPFAESLIRTVHGIGYRICEPDEA